MVRAPYALSPRVPARALLLSIAALAVPVAVTLLFPEALGQYDPLLWLLALVPAFLLAYYRGWRGVATSLAGGMAVLSLSQATIALTGAGVQFNPLLLAVVAIYVAVSLGIGWLTELLHRERALAQQEAVYVVLVLGADGRIRYASPSAERVLGFTPDILVNRPIFDYVHPDDRHAIQVGLDTRNRDDFPLDFRFRNSNGAWRALQGQATNLFDDPAVAGLVVRAFDISERRNLQEQLRLAQRMEAVGRLAGGVAHDFNNVLTIIQGHVQILGEDLGPDHPSRSDVEEIRKAAEHARTLTAQLLAFSRQQVLRPRVLDLNAVVSDIDRMLGRLIGEDIELVLDLDPGLGRIRADAGQIEQVLFNLAVNARDAMPHGGRLTLRTRNAEIDERFASRFTYLVRTGPYVRLDVCDTGIGMDERTQAHVFEPFFTTKAVGKGTGLGLSTVYGIVKQSGGYIWVESEVGKGTTLHLWFPRVEAPLDEEETGDHPAPASVEGRADACETILVVEDDAAVRSLIRKVLGRYGYRVLEAVNGRDAIDTAERYDGHIDLVVSDLVMPEMGGRELAARIARVRPDARLLLMSGYTEDAVMRADVFDPDTAFIQKPFSPDEFARKVREVLGQVRA